MIKVISSRFFWGLILLVGGILLLLDTIGVIKGGSIFWTVATAVVALLFLSVVAMNHVQWWALIPGTILLALSATIGLNSFIPGFSESNLNSTIILGGISLSFLLVYLVERSNWWAIIPMGVIATIAIVAINDTSSSTVLSSGGIFFLGIGVTFALVALLPSAGGHMRWAWIPAGVLGVIGLILLITVEEYINYIWPSILIFGGLILVGRSLKKR